jgi:hypothetical protein
VADIPCIGRNGKDSLAQKEDKGEEDMKPFGWIFMTVSWVIITGLVIFCFRKIFAKKQLD